MLTNNLYISALATFTFITSTMVSAAQTSQPNIVFIFVDDLGWNDVGFNNPDIVSPNIDKLAKEGVILNQTYVQPVCSPSRAALMTGVYPHRMGLQHMVINAEQPVCVPLNLTLLPQVLKDAGYSTHMVGKWHLGFCDWRCVPTSRGFDSFLGFYNSGEDYISKMAAQGFDFRDYTSVAKNDVGTYSTFQFTNRLMDIIADHDTDRPLFLYVSHQNVHSPLDIPQNYSHLYPNIKDDARRNLSTMVTILDDSIGLVVDSLKAKGLWENTLLIFSSDNGGATRYGGNNYPLRGGKISIFEGGTRGAAFVHGPMFKKTGVRYDGLMHVVDWFPTLAEAAGTSYNNDDQDGVSQWQSLLNLSLPSAREEVLYNLDLTWDPIQGRAAIRVGDWKYIAGFPGIFESWYPPAGVTTPEPWEVALNMTFKLGAGQSSNMDEGEILHETARRIFKTTNPQSPIWYYLFNLKEDPNERNNVYDDYPDIVKELSDRLDAYRGNYVEPNDPSNDRDASPRRWNGIWTPGWCPDIKVY